MRRTIQKIMMVATLWLLMDVSAIGQSATTSATWWGLWKTTQGTSGRMMLDDAWHDCYIRLTAQNCPLAVGGQITGVRFWVWDKTAIRSASVWVSASYPGAGGMPSVVRIEVSTTDLHDVLHDGQPTEVFFDEAYDILPASNPYALIYVGYSLDLQSDRSTYLVSGQGSSTVGSNYVDGLDVAPQYGAAAVQALVSSPRLPERFVTVTSPTEMVAQHDTESTVDLTVTNSGSERLRSVTYQVSIDGAPQQKRFYTTPSPIDELGLTFTIPVQFTAPTDACEHKLAVAITQVNGSEQTPTEAVNATASTTSAVNLVVLDGPTLRRTVMEEFTGTWCNNCVRGMLGIQRLQEMHGERFIPIAVHGDDRDPMMIDGYYRSQFFRDKMAVLGGYPSCTIDRLFDCDPYCGWQATGPWATDAIVEQALNRPAVADIVVEARWAEDTQNSLEAMVNTRFGYSSDEAHYALVLVLTADGLSGEGRDWLQRNGYNDYTGDDEGLQTFVGQGTYLPKDEFNHAAIGVWGVDGGLEASISAPLVASQPQQFTYTLSTAGNVLVQDGCHLFVVALLIDTRDGSVVNAAQSSVLTASDTAVRGLQHDDSTSVAPIYDLQGRRQVRAPQRQGIYIYNGRKVSK